MKRKHITQIFPFLLPIRRAQRKLFFYAGMYFDSNRYAITITPGTLSHCIYFDQSKLINENTGFDMHYQKNKVFNLRLACETVDMLLIRPQETFSFWHLVRTADKYERYKDGLALINGELCTMRGGGLCHLSNFLYWMFLHTPLTVIERHPHKIQDFPSPDEGDPAGIDATVSEGWSDLKVQNRTDATFQINLSVDNNYLYGRILTDQPFPYAYKVFNRDKRFFQKNGRVYGIIPVIRQTVDRITDKVLSERCLYTDICEIGYPLPNEIEIKAIEE